MTARVLIVDDSLTVRMDLAEAFESAGFEVSLADTAAAALAIAREQRVDAIVLDVVLPDADGLDLLETINAFDPRPPVILLSTEAEVAHRIRGLRTGADDYVGKPYDRGYIVARARELARERSGADAGTPVATSILVVDDSPTYRDALERALRGAGYEVLVATSGEEGLRLAASSRPTAILVDGVMTGIDGGTVIRRIRLDAALRKTPCILLTATQGPTAELDALEAGADAFVRKEEDLEVILLRLAAVLRAGTSHRDEAASLLDPKRVLAVDDSPSYLNELASVLQGEGYDVVLARSGEEALHLLAAQRVDCILLDLMMPGIDGIETCRRVKQSPVTRDIPLILLTASEDKSAMIAALSKGADDFIAKSGEFEVLKARVRAQLRRSQFEDEHRRAREQLLRSELEAAGARAAHELAETRAALVAELQKKNAELESAYHELQTAQSKLVQSAKMASLGELVAGVAHEINNPLAFAISHLETARKSLEKLGIRVAGEGSQGERWHYERAENRLSQMGIGLERIRELVVKLRTFSRLDEGELKVVGIRESVESLLTIVGHRLKTRIRVVTEFGPPDRLECYPGLLNQALLNLISNSIDAIDGEGCIRITTGADGDGYRIVVADTGHGVPEDIRARIVEPFFTTKPVGQGTGLGLSITDSIVRRHGGTLEFGDAEGGGTVVTLRLPLRTP
ncbi:MAG TPA: response regulator [Polyangiaceae bacterium]